MTVIERAARALCKFDGHSENITFEGAPMWRSYVAQARASFDAARTAAPTGTDAETWRSMIDAVVTAADGLQV